MTVRFDPIPLVDIRDGGPVRHATQSAIRAKALRDDCIAWLPGMAEPLVPAFDLAARRWLSRSRSPYIGEIESIVAALGISGVWLLNGCYQWGCTTLAREQAGVPWLARTLDWPFPGLGRHVELARMHGPAGEFFHLTWPGYVGALTAMAPGRFAAAINQAPLFRRTRHRYLRVYDLAANAVRTWREVTDIPPDQLSRQVFETCRSFAEARRMLETTPVARPVIYSLVGVKAGERCVIERTETGFATRMTETVAANDWHPRRDFWEARIAGDMMLTCESDAAADNSRARRETLVGWDGVFGRDDFGWLAEPVLNRFTRLAVEMCPAEGILRAVGYENVPGEELPRPATGLGEIRAAVAA